MSLKKHEEGITQNTHTHTFSTISYDNFFRDVNAVNK